MTFKCKQTSSDPKTNNHDNPSSNDTRNVSVCQPICFQPKRVRYEGHQEKAKGWQDLTFFSRHLSFCLESLFGFSWRHLNQIYLGHAQEKQSINPWNGCNLASHKLFGINQNESLPTNLSRIAIKTRYHDAVDHLESEAQRFLD